MWAQYKELIERNGGLVVEFIECCVYQIYPIEEEAEGLPDGAFFTGEIYSSEWVTKSIEKGRIDFKEAKQFIVWKPFITQDINFARTKFSIREVIKLF